jgi:hypothetical protein
VAGEWLKFECSLPEKPETLAITIAMGWDDPDLTVGKLMRLFRWFDQQTLDGNAPSVSAALLDRIIGVSGFVQAVADVGWIVIEGTSIHLANFDRHNGATAKSRAQTAKRVANHKTNAAANAEGNARTVSEALPREEKKREEVTTSLRSVVSATRATRKCPESFEVTTAMQDWAATDAPCVDLKRETEKFRDHTFKTAHTDWPGAWRNWIRRSAETTARPAQASGETPYQRSMRERMQQIVPGLAARAPDLNNIIEMEAANVAPRRLDR